MPSILFVCTANRFRSPLAALYFAREVVRNSDDHDISVSSAGTWAIPKQQVMPEVRELAKGLGLNVGLHKSRMVTENILSQADLILVMESGHKEAISHEFPSVADRIFLLTEVTSEIPYDIPDPYTSDENIDEVASEIIELIDQGYEKIIQFSKNMAKQND